MTLQRHTSPLENHVGRPCGTPRGTRSRDPRNRPWSSDQDDAHIRKTATASFQVPVSASLLQEHRRNQWRRRCRSRAHAATGAERPSCTRAQRSRVAGLAYDARREPLAPTRAVDLREARGQHGGRVPRGRRGRRTVLCAGSGSLCESAELELAPAPATRRSRTLRDVRTSHAGHRGVGRRRFRTEYLPRGKRWACTRGARAYEPSSV